MTTSVQDTCKQIARLLQQVLSAKFAGEYYRRAWEPDAKEVFVLERSAEGFKVYAGSDYNGRLSIESLLSPLGEQIALNTCIKFIQGENYRLLPGDRQWLDSMIIQGLEQTFPRIFEENSASQLAVSEPSS